MSYPSPILNLQFANTKQMPPAVAFSRASIGSYFDSSGILRYANAGVPRFDHDPLTGICKGLLVESNVTFLDTCSEQFDNAAWTKTRATITANATTAPDGTLTADKLVEDTTATNTHIMQTSITFSSGTIYTQSFILEQAGRSDVAVSFGAAAFGSNVRYSFSLVGSGVYARDTAGTNDSASISYLGNGRYLVTVSAQATATTTSSITIFLKDASANTTAYTGDGTSGLYIWGAKIYAGSYPVSSLPTGWETTSTSSNNVGTGAKTFTVGNNSATAGKSIPAGATVRVWQTSNPSNYLYGTVTSHSGTTITLNITGSGGSGTGVTDWTIQAGASVTRAGEIASVDFAQLLDAAGNQLWTGDTFTLVIRCRVSSKSRFFAIHDGTYDNRLLIYVDANGRVGATLTNAGVTQFTVAAAQQISIDTNFCVVLAVKNNDVAIFVNGVPGGTDTTASIPTSLRWANPGYDGVSWCYAGATIAAVQLYNHRIDDAYLPALSTL